MGSYGNRLIYKFPITYPGQIWIINSSPYGYEYAYVTWIGYLAIFNRIIKGVHILYTADEDTIWQPGIQLWSEEHYLGDGIGLVWWGNEVEYKFLIGCIINGDTLGIIVNVEDKKVTNPYRFELYQNYPNPFNRSTTIQYQISKSSEVILKVYNILGKEMRELINEYKSPGLYEANWDGKDNNGIEVGTGVYFCTLTVKNSLDNSSRINTFIKKLILIK